MVYLMECLKNLFIGMVVGGVFALIKLPAPAPNAIPPVLAIMGITLGYLLVLKIME